MGCFCDVIRRLETITEYLRSLKSDLGPSWGGLGCSHVARGHHGVGSGCSRPAQGHYGVVWAVTGRLGAITEKFQLLQGGSGPFLGGAGCDRATRGRYGVIWGRYGVAQRHNQAAEALTGRLRALLGQLRALTGQFRVTQGRYWGA